MRYLFMVPPTLLIGAIHFYVWLRLVRDTRLTAWPRRIATATLAGFVLLYPTTFIVWFRIYSSYRWHFALVYGWLGALLYVAAALVACDAGRALTWLLGRSRSPARARAEMSQPTAATERTIPSREPFADYAASPEPGALAGSPVETRRVFVARAIAGSALITGGATAVFGVRAALWDITTPEVPIALARLPRALDGYTIALLTDIHIGQVLDRRFLRHLVEETNRLKPDAIAIGGDLADGRVFEVGPQHVSELRHLRARDGVFYVTGNHEYFWGAPAWMEFVTQLGVRVLLNQRVALGDADRAGAQLDLVGVPDLSAAKREPIGADIDAATAGRDPQRELVVLAHQPLQIAASARVGAGLQLSGHTHGGQLNPFGAASVFSQGYVAGLHRHAGTDTQIYVSRGSGFWGPPMRVFAPAEITRIRLYRA